MEEMRALTPTQASRLPLKILKIVAAHSSPNELICWSHLCRRFRQEVASQAYWTRYASKLGLTSEKPLLAYIRRMFEYQLYFKDPDLVDTLPLSERACILQFITTANQLNGVSKLKSVQRAIILRDALKREMVSDAMAQQRAGLSPLVYLEALHVLDGMDSFIPLWTDYMVGIYTGLIDMSSMDPYVYYQGKDFHSDKFDIFLKQFGSSLGRYTQEIHTNIPASQFSKVWEALVARFHTEVLFKLINYLCDIDLNFVSSIFTCLQPYFDTLLELNPDTTKAFVGAPFAEWVEKSIRYQTIQFREVASQMIKEWKVNLEESEEETERFLWSNVTRTHDKTNFLSSFKRVLWTETQGSSEQQDQEDTQGSLTSPTTEMEAQVAVLLRKVEGIKGLLNLEMVLGLIDNARASFLQLHKFSVLEGEVTLAAREEMVKLFADLLEIVGFQHVQDGFNKAINTLNMYDPKKYRRLVAKDDAGGETAVEPLALFAELINVGDLIQQTIHVFFRQELVAFKLVDPNDFASKLVNRKRKFEQLLDEKVAEGLNRGVDVLMDQVDFIFVTEQLGSDFNPFPGTLAELGPTAAAKDVVSMIDTHVKLLSRSLDKYVAEVFQQEVGMRLWSSLCKHIKRSSVSTEGAITLISDVNWYHSFILSLKQRSLYPYFEALKQVCQLYLISPKDGKQLGAAISDMNRFQGMLPSDELVEFMKCRTDWPQIKPKVEKALYGFGECCIQ